MVSRDYKIHPLPIPCIKYMEKHYRFQNYPICRALTLSPQNKGFFSVDFQNKERKIDSDWTKTSRNCYNWGVCGKSCVNAMPR